MTTEAHGKHGIFTDNFCVFRGFRGHIPGPGNRQEAQFTGKGLYQVASDLFIIPTPTNMYDYPCST